MQQRWREAAPILAYDDTDIRVVFQPGGSDFLLVTFGDALLLADGLRFAADALVRKHGIACLGFMAHDANWFPADAVARAMPHIAYTLKSFRRILTYGCSMGAYAAIKHADVLGATEVLALGPQWSIDPAECAFDCGYHGFYRPRMAGMGIRAADLAGRIAVLHDPGHALDRHHAAAIAALGPSVVRVPVYSADHHLAPMLAGSDATFGLMQAWLRDDGRELSRLLAQRRRPSPVRIRVLLAKAVQRHPVMALAAVDLLGRSGRIAMVEAGLHLVPLLQALLARDRVDLAVRAFDVAGCVLPPVQAEILRQDFVRPLAASSPQAPQIRTAHGTTLFYDAVSGSLRHRAAPAASSRLFALHPASLVRDAMPPVLLVPIPTMTGQPGPVGSAPVCALGPGGRLDLVRTVGADTVCIRAVPLGAAAFALAVGERYLCAAPDGQVFHDRTEVNSWERFTLA